MRRVLVLLAVLAAACVQDPPPGARPTCTTDPECPTGQRCIDKQCFAASPGDLQFSAELFAPENKPDMLARAEVPALAIDENTMRVNVMFARSIRVEGRVLLHNWDTLSAAAKVVFRRPSRIKGAPDYEVAVDAMPGKVAGEAAFSARILPNDPGETYDITIYPDDGTLFALAKGQQAPNTLAPPVTLASQSFRTAPQAPLDLTCDSTGLRGVTGYVVDGMGQPLGGLTVRAYSEPTSAVTKAQLVSSTATTDPAGFFTIYLPTSKASAFDLKVSAGPGQTAPTLLRVRPDTTSGIHGATTTGPIVLGPIAYPPYPALQSYALPVSYDDVGGGHKPAVGALASFSTTLMVSDHDTVTYEVSALVDADGQARVSLIPGGAGMDRQYKVTVLPRQGTQTAPSVGQAVWDRGLAIGSPGASTLAELVLPTRIRVSGSVLDSQRRAAGNITVRPQIASTLTDPLSAESRDRLAALSLPEVTTDDKGAFAFYVDPTLLGRSAVYDLELVPPGGSVLPRWSKNGVEIPSDTSGALDAGPIMLPAAALATGPVTDEDNAPVANAEVRVYARAAGEDTAKLRTLAKSDASGMVVLVLPSQ
jgi:hypothetical protein